MKDLYVLNYLDKECCSTAIDIYAENIKDAIDIFLKIPILTNSKSYFNNVNSIVSIIKHRRKAMIPLDTKGNKYDNGLF